MSNKSCIANILQKLEIAYPAYKTDKGQAVFDLWFDTLAGYSVDVIDDAVRLIVENNKFYPSLNEFITACKKVSIPDEIDAPYSRLLQRRLDLENKLYDTGEFNADEWSTLADEFDVHDKPNAAERCRKRISQMEAPPNY